MNNIFSNYAVIIGTKSDFFDLLKALVKLKIPLFYENEKLFINYDKNFLASIKDMNLTVQQPDIVSLKIYWADYEDEKLSFIKKLIDKNKFSAHFMGDDGSWLATPYYLIWTPASKDHIFSLAKSGYFGPLANSLWKIGS